MEHIVLTNQQADIVTNAKKPVEARDSQGRPLARLIPFDPAEVEAITRSRQSLVNDKPGIPSAEVQTHLQKLEEIGQREELDEARVMDLLRRMRAGEPV